MDISKLLNKKLDKKVFDLLRQAGALADSMGLPAYLVGGMVRDLLMGEKPGRDIDITVEGDGLEFAKTFADDAGASYKGFEKFRTARIFLKDGFRIDVAGARAEQYPEPGMLPVVELAAINHDLYRRDFTVNAMAVKINGESFGELLDPFNGQADMEKKELKVLHEKSFSDDPTRMLRFIRFKSRLGFSADARTAGMFRRGIVKNVFDTVSGERLRDEILLMLREKDSYKVLKELAQCGALGILAPGIKIRPGLKRLLSVISGNEGELEKKGINPLVMKLAAFLGYSGAAAVNTFIKKFKICNEWAAAILQSGRAVGFKVKLLKKLSPGKVHKLCTGFGKEALYYMKYTAGKTAAGNISNYMRALDMRKTAITGHDLIKIGVNPGKKLGMILGKVIEARLDGKIKSREEELLYARRYM